MSFHPPAKKGLESREGFEKVSSKKQISGIVEKLEERLIIVVKKQNCYGDVKRREKSGVRKSWGNEVKADLIYEALSLGGRGFCPGIRESACLRKKSERGTTGARAYSHYHDETLPIAAQWLREKQNSEG